MIKDSNDLYKLFLKSNKSNQANIDAVDVNYFDWLEEKVIEYLNKKELLENDGK